MLCHRTSRISSNTDDKTVDIRLSPRSLSPSNCGRYCDAIAAAPELLDPTINPTLQAGVYQMEDGSMISAH